MLVQQFVGGPCAGALARGAEGRAPVPRAGHRGVGAGTSITCWDQPILTKTGGNGLLVSSTGASVEELGQLCSVHSPGQGGEQGDFAL